VIAGLQFTRSKGPDVESLLELAGSSDSYLFFEDDVGPLWKNTEGNAAQGWSPGESSETKKRGISEFIDCMSQDEGQFEPHGLSEDTPQGTLTLTLAPIPLTPALDPECNPNSKTLALT
jgi:hypothetical protein